MVDYEKGSPSWDIGIILTRHEDGCARRKELERSNAQTFKPDPHRRLQLALDTDCDCGRGDSEAERTSYRAAKT